MSTDNSPEREAQLREFLRESDRKRLEQYIEYITLLEQIEDRRRKGLGTAHDELEISFAKICNPELMHNLELSKKLALHRLKTGRSYWGMWERNLLYSAIERNESFNIYHCFSSERASSRNSHKRIQQRFRCNVAAHLLELAGDGKQSTIDGRIDTLMKERGISSWPEGLSQDPFELHGDIYIRRTMD